jgi:ubiquinone/menaquinone biosynthesis C-methylase UbiE
MEDTPFTEDMTVEKPYTDQYKRPRGRRGRQLAAEMNHWHAHLTLWGLLHVNIESDYVILDVGCGGGATVSRLAQRAVMGKVFGIDYSADMVEYSKKVNKKLIAQNRVEIIEGSVVKMHFSDNLFDLVTAIEVYYFWPNFFEVLQEIKRVLKPDGKLLMVNEMVKDGVYEINHAKLIQKTQVRLFSLEEIRHTLQSAGFVDVQIFTKDNTPWNLILAQKK